MYQLIKADIVLGRLAPGEDVTEVRLGQRYGFGRAPVRAALSKLVQEGLVRVVPRRGYVISSITVRAIQEICELRMVLEPYAARAAVGHVSIQRLRDLNPYPGEADAAGQHLWFIQSNHQFHREIFGACGNQRLIRLLSGLYDEMDRTIHLCLFTERDKSVMRINHEAQGRQHDDIIAAFERKDPAAVEESVRQHIESTRDLALKAILDGRVSVPL